MSAIARPRWTLRLATLVVWALLGVSLAWWGLKLSRPAGAPPVPLAAAAPLAVDAQALARVLGAQAPASTAAASAPARLVLQGVLVGTQNGDGAALIAVDGKPAKPYRVGAELQPGLIVQSLGRREVRLGSTLDGPVTMTLELPRPSPSLSPSPAGRGRG